ncbi:MAG TPA: adenosylmethionine decarboxylase [Methyloprofundus sp.]|nr:adenosylmethionine decarboxylase [Methyloprofundus sp.]HIL77890.1 adenosylmethionine decarboxylase [Methylococcales bacterium]
MYSIRHNMAKNNKIKDELGKHVLIDCKGDIAHMREDVLSEIMRKAAKLAGATVLSANFHQFGGDGGITGVLVLAESHITVHTWPEYDYAAFDIFMCGDCDVDKAVDVIRAASKESVFDIKKVARGVGYTCTH